MLFLFKKISIPSECQTVWIQIKPDVLLGLIWDQAVRKVYQTTPVGKEVTGVIIMSDETVWYTCANSETERFICIISQNNACNILFITFRPSVTQTGLM